jgi:hypothetical protein
MDHRIRRQARHSDPTDDRMADLAAAILADAKYSRGEPPEALGRNGCPHTLVR